jgi:hypothetical protein
MSNWIIRNLIKSGKLTKPQVEELERLLTCDTAWRECYRAIQEYTEEKGSPNETGMSQTVRRIHEMGATERKVKAQRKERL